MNRRQWITQSAFGLGSAALNQLLAGTHHPAKADACIFLGMLGGVSQIDTFDPKPKLVELNGKIMDWSKEKKTDQPNLFAKPRKFVASPFKFAKYGQSGREVSELLPHTAQCVDDLAVVRSVQSDNGNHPAAVFQMNTGFIIPGNPSMGAWVTYGLGSPADNLPAYVVMPQPEGTPEGGTPCWSSGFLPSVYQGTLLRSGPNPILHLKNPNGVTPERQKNTLDLLQEMNRLDSTPGDNEHAARIASYELAFKMQSAAPEAVDLSKESEATKKLYGLDEKNTYDFGSRLLLARRLIERGTRFVQIYSGGGPVSIQWDAHKDLVANHEKMSGLTDKPIAGLLKDLKSRGLLDETLVIWGSEFGRLPMSEGGNGRDHNPHGFTMWFAGGGVKGGRIVGETDEFGLNAIGEKYHMRDFHATILHALGLDQHKLFYLHNGRNEKLTDFGGTVIDKVFI